MSEDIKKLKKKELALFKQRKQLEKQIQADNMDMGQLKSLSIVLVN